MLKRVTMLVLILILLMPSTVFAAQSTTFTFGVNRKGWFVRTQDAYLPDRTVIDLRLSSPENICFGTGETDKDILYIADTGNRRIVLYDVKSDDVVREIAHPDFKAPRGVYATPDGSVYVADSAAGLVFIFDSNGELSNTIGRPNSMAFGDTQFAPYRIAVDLAGSLYIVGEGVYNGIIQLSRTGEFLGYFTSNRTTLTWVQFLQNIFFTDEQLEGLLDRVPITFSNVFTDSRGIVYTTSMGRERAGLQKHDVAGKNMLSDVWTTSSTTSVTVDQYGMIYTTDVHGYIAVYSNDGEEIFFFGSGRSSEEDIAGIYSSLMSIAVSSDGHIWTLDSDKSFLQSFSPTEYAESIYRALLMFNEGRYSDAGAEWTNVLRFNQMSVLAHNGLGKSYLYRQNYQNAQRHFEVAGNREFYSQAFWETRNEWLLNNLVYVLIMVVIIIIISNAIKYIDRKKVIKSTVRKYTRKVKETPSLANFFFAFSVARHPLDSYYYMKRKEKATNLSATILFILFFISFMLYQTSKAYIFQLQEIEDMDFNVIISGFFGVAFLFIVCNYLVTSINDGEGSISDIFKVVSYSAFPLAVTLLFTTAITYIITENEAFIVSFMLFGGFTWSGSVLYLGLQEIHNYNFRDTVKSLIFTIIFMVIVLVVLFNLSILFGQFVQFIEAVGREFISNVTGIY